MKGIFDDARAGEMIEIYGSVNGVRLDPFFPRGSLGGHVCNPAPVR